MSSDLVNQTADILLETGMVPLPGGHGTRWREVRNRFPELFNAPDTIARCYACVSLLGRGARNGSSERWTRKEWWPHAEAWFDSNASHVVVPKGVRRWEIMLEAMVEVIRRWSMQDRDRFHSEWYHAATACAPEAKRLLKDITKIADMPLVLSAALKVAPAQGDQGADARWRLVQQAFKDGRGDDVALLYFLNVFHTSLGVQQFSPDVAYATRRTFYMSVQRILRSSPFSTSGLGEAAERTASALGRTNVVSPPSEKWCDHLAFSLPKCFQFAGKEVRPPLRRQIDNRLAGSGVARHRLCEAHDLAEVLADRVMDLLKVRTGNPNSCSDDGFGQNDYSFLHNQLKSAPGRMVQQAKWQDETEIAEDSGAVVHPLTKRFAEQMALGAIPNQAQTAADEVTKAPRGTQKGI